MKSILDEQTRDSLIARIGHVDKSSKGQWGKMNVYQMLRHCTAWDEMIIHNERHKRVFIGLFLGKFFLRNELKDEKPMRRNNPTIPALVIKQLSGDVEDQKRQWVAMIKLYADYHYSDYRFVHPFFGKMTKAQIGYHAYKHTDHHLRQFGC